MKRKILCLLAGLCIVSLIVGCTPVEETPKTSGKVMNVGKYYWPGQFWIEIADDKGWFDEAGLHVVLVDTNADFFGSLEDMAEGKLDTTLFTLFDLMEFNERGADLVAALAVDISFGADTIVSKSDIAHIAELKGKRIGVQRGSFTEYLLDAVLQRNNLRMEDVILVETQAEDIKPLVDGRVDAIVTWEPFSSLAVSEGNGRIIFDSSQIPGLIGDINPFQRSFIEQRPQDVQTFVNVWHKTTEWMKQHPEEGFQIIANIYGVPVGDVQSFSQDVKILDLEDNKIAFSYAAGFGSLHGTARQINNFMIEKGITDKQLDSIDFIDARFIRNVK